MKTLPGDMSVSAASIAASMQSATLEQNQHELQLQARDDRWASLLAQAQRGDSAAFAAFYKESASLALSVARRIAPAHAQDVLAEAYLQAFEGAASFDVQLGRAGTWLLTMVRSRALDKLRREKLRQGVDLESDDAESFADQNPSADLGPDALLESTEAKGLLHRALADLSSNERWVLGLAFYQDLTQSEIAQTTALPLGTVKSLMHRAQAKLRSALTKAMP
jgi:RNA polymerase sigma-70 factor (ECF subfamily)